MKVFVVLLDCKRDVPTKVFLPAESVDVAIANARYWWGRSVGSIQELTAASQRRRKEVSNAPVGS